MYKRNLLLVMVIFITFIGGFFTGVYYDSNQNNSKNKVTINNLPQSSTKPEQKEKPVKPKAKTKVLIGYIQDFRDPNMMDYSKITHVNFSFVHPTKNGGIMFGGDYAIQNLRKTVAKAHKQNVKVILAIGGWSHLLGGESYPYFKAAISNPNTRTKLINRLVKTAERENLDGIDIDFEHPRSNKDAEKLLLFTKSLSEKLHQQNKELSIAVNAKIHSVAGTEIHNVVYRPEMFQYVDHVNIMAYDGQWDGEYNAANLSPFKYSENIVNYWTNLFDSHHISKEKLVLGVPVYAQPVNPGIKQVSYATIVNSNPKNAKRNTVQMNGTTYYYNGELTVQRKTKLALSHGLGGMMLWEAGHDVKGPLSLTTAISDVLEDANLLALNKQK